MTETLEAPQKKCRCSPWILLLNLLTLNNRELKWGAITRLGAAVRGVLLSAPPAHPSAHQQLGAVAQTERGLSDMVTWGVAEHHSPEAVKI